MLKRKATWYMVQYEQTCLTVHRIFLVWDGLYHLGFKGKHFNMEKQGKLTAKKRGFTSAPITSIQINPVFFPSWSAQLVNHKRSPSNAQRITRATSRSKSLYASHPAPSKGSCLEQAAWSGTRRYGTLVHEEKCSFY